MKKLLAISITLVLFAGAAFAQVTVGGWGRANFVPFGNNGEYSYANTHVNWGGAPNFALNFSASGEQIGLVFNFDVNTSDIDGNAYVWWKPLDQFQLDIGRARWDALRGSYGLGDSFGNYSNNRTDGEEGIFSRFTTTEWWNTAEAKGGAILRITPLENLYIGVAIPTGYDADPPANDVENVYKRSQYAAGYNIDGIGLARVGYFGQTGSGIGLGGQKEADNPAGQIIQAAFKLTAVEALGVDFGFSYGLNTPKDTNNIEIGLGLGAKAGEGINIQFNANVWAGGDKDKTGKAGSPVLAFYLNPEFDLGFATVGLGVALDTTLYGGDGGFGFGGNVHISKNVGGGNIKAGIALAKAAEFKGADATRLDYATGDTDVTFAIPVQITYSF